MEQERKDILEQEPDVQPVECMDDADGYVAYISLDFLNEVFASEDMTCDCEKQQEFIDKLQDNLLDVLKRRKEKRVIFSWSFISCDGSEHHAVEVVPVKKVHGLRIETPDWNAYNELHNKVNDQQAKIDKLENMVQQLQHRLEKAETAIIWNN